MGASFSLAAASAAWQLPNGLTVRVLSTPGKPRAAALLSVATGSHNEPQAWPGLAHLLEHVLFGDNQQYRWAERLMPWTEAAGGQVNACTESASTQFFSRCRQQRWRRASVGWWRCWRCRHGRHWQRCGK